MSKENRTVEKQKILDLFQSKIGLKKLKKAGVAITDDFGEILPIEKIIRNLGYNKIDILSFEKAFGKKWTSSNWSAILEILHSNIEPDCLTLTIQDIKGNKIMSAYINAFQLFSTLEYKSMICSTIADSVFRTLLFLPTHREFISDLENDNKPAVDALKNQLDYFKGDPRNDFVLSLIETHSPKLRALIKEKLNY